MRLFLIDITDTCLSCFFSNILYINSCMYVYRYGPTYNASLDTIPPAVIFCYSYDLFRLRVILDVFKWVSLNKRNPRWENTPKRKTISRHGLTRGVGDARNIHNMIHISNISVHGIYYERTLQRAHRLRVHTKNNSISPIYNWYY